MISPAPTLLDNATENKRHNCIKIFTKKYLNKNVYIQEKSSQKYVLQYAHLIFVSNNYIVQGNSILEFKKRCTHKLTIPIFDYMYLPHRLIQMGHISKKKRWDWIVLVY